MTAVAVIIGMAASMLLQSIQWANALFEIEDFSRSKAPIATSEDNVYVAWWSNKTGNDEVMFKASTDGGKTFSDKMNLSNTPRSDSQDAEIAAAGNNVYVHLVGEKSDNE